MIHWHLRFPFSDKRHQLNKSIRLTDWLKSVHLWLEEGFYTYCPSCKRGWGVTPRQNLENLCANVCNVEHFDPILLLILALSLSPPTRHCWEMTYYVSSGTLNPTNSLTQPSMGDSCCSMCPTNDRCLTIVYIGNTKGIHRRQNKANKSKLTCW